MIADIFVDRYIKSNDAPNFFSYKYDDKKFSYLKVGSKVIIPFGKNNDPILGVVINIRDDVEDEFELKEIYECEKELYLSAQQFKIAEFISSNTDCNYIQAIKLFFPPGSFNKVEKRYVLNNDIRKTLGIKNFVIYDKQYKNFSEEHKKIIMDNSEVQFFSNKTRKDIKSFSFKISNTDESLTKKQKEIIDYIIKFGIEQISELVDEGFSLNSINNLIKKKVITLTTSVKKVDEYKKLELNPEQKNVYETILESEYNKFLIHGITGSGKTEIYLQLAEKFVREGKSVLVLVPEIALTTQIIKRFEGRFKQSIAIIHSGLSISEKLSEYEKIRNGEVKIIIGARSALFAPFKDLGLIVIDEEHDSSYISQMTPKYNSIEVASFISEKFNVKLVLGSATPSLNTFYDCLQGKIKLLSLSKRANNISLPEIIPVNMSNELSKGNFSIFSNKLVSLIKENLDNGFQTILLINKRGFSSFINCRSCGHTIKCPHCDISMTYHKHLNRLVCHYCGYTSKIPEKCPKCSSNKIKDFGVGTEQVETSLRKILKNARIARMDRDTMKSLKNYEDIYEGMNSHKIDILIGTQMIAKGFDFKNVTLVGILATDMMLNLPDYRSNEWSFQLFNQVSGRAGRGKIKGKVVLQTYESNNFVIKAALNNDFNQFAKKELMIRKNHLYPPFSDVYVVRFENRDNKIVQEDIYNQYRIISDYIKTNDLKILIEKPMPCMITKIKDKYRWQFIIKSLDKDKEKIIMCLKTLLKKQAILEINPINML